MGIEAISTKDVNARSVRSLGLDPEVIDLSAPEALACALRRAASFLCPTTANHLVSAVEDSLTGLIDVSDGLRESTTEMLAALVGYGDLLELRVISDDANRERTQIYLAPPSFVSRRSGSFLLFGIRPDGAPLVGEELMPRVQNERHVRRIAPGIDIDVRGLLGDYGLHELSEETWLRSPHPASAKDVGERFDYLLSRAGAPGTIEGLIVLDPAKPVRYYSGRWRPVAARDNGNFVARRPQAFGAPIWCYVRVTRGSLTNAIDLPADANALTRGCDAAWYLQAAIDAIAGHPQVLRLRRMRGRDRATLELFSPPPSWLQRRWDAIGTPVSSRGALVAYTFDEREVAEEAEYGSRMLWLDVVEEAE